MKKMICEICGSQNLKKENGVFICKECGTEYSLEEAKKLVKEVETEVNTGTNSDSKENISSLVETGWKIINKDPLDNTQFKLLSEIKDKIALVDFENPDAKLFQCMIEIGEGKPNNKHIEELLELDNKHITDFLVKQLIDKTKSSISTLFTIDGGDMLYYKIEMIGFSYLGYIEPLKNNYDKLSDNQKKEYDELLSKIKDASEHLIELVYDAVNCFIFTKDSVSSFEFTNGIFKLVSNAHIFVSSVSNYIDAENINATCKKIYDVFDRNAQIIMTNTGYGALVLQYAAKLAGMDENKAKEKVDNIEKTVTGCWCAGKPITLKLYGDRAVVTGIGPERNIPKKNVLKVNHHPSVYQVGYSMKTTYWWDLVYKIDDSTYTVLHFGYDLKDLETVYDCTQWKDIQEWCSRIGISLSTENYKEGNPFIHGIGNYRYVDTQEQYKASRGTTKSGCYVATCVYGSYDCPQVWTLRRYRDYKLNKTWFGRLFIKLYYSISPTLVKWFGNTSWFKKMWKGKLDKMVSKYKALGFEDTPYEDLY